MKRRNFLTAAAAGCAAATAGGFILANGFSLPKPEPKSPVHIKPETAEGVAENWVYHPLSVDTTASLTYNMYDEGSCMFATFGSVIKQLAEQYGEPYASFPYAMMKYGASGIGGYGSVCGSLNGAGALVGLFVQSKDHQKAIIEDIYSWYETSMLPVFKPAESNATVVSTVSNSVLCHASTANWSKESGYRTDGPERKERCKRLASDVAQKTVRVLNQYFDNGHQCESNVNVESANCMQCHSNKGKLGNMKGKMNCTSCHDTSLAHTLFADVHYSIMD